MLEHVNTGTKTGCKQCRIEPRRAVKMSKEEVHPAQLAREESENLHRSTSEATNDLFTTLRAVKLHKSSYYFKKKTKLILIFKQMIEKVEKSVVLTCLVRFSWRTREHPASGWLRRLQTRTQRNLRWTWRHPTRRPTHRNQLLRTDAHVAMFNDLRDSKDLCSVPQQAIRSLKQTHSAVALD